MVGSITDTDVSFWHEMRTCITGLAVDVVLALQAAPNAGLACPIVIKKSILANTDSALFDESISLIACDAGVRVRAVQAPFNALLANSLVEEVSLITIAAFLRIRHEVSLSVAVFTRVSILALQASHHTVLAVILV